MKEMQRKQKVRRVIYSIPSLVILAIVAVLLARGAFRVMEKEYESKVSSRELAAKVAALTRREEVLRGDIARLQTEEGIKDEIKERFSVTQEGEYVAVIVDDRRSSSSADSTLPWYKRVWAVIMGSQ